VRVGIREIARIDLVLAARVAAFAAVVALVADFGEVIGRDGGKARVLLAGGRRVTDEEDKAEGLPRSRGDLIDSGGYGALHRHAGALSSLEGLDRDALDGEARERAVGEEGLDSIEEVARANGDIGDVRAARQRL
jgi:hypothetical protein